VICPLRSTTRCWPSTSTVQLITLQGKKKQTARETQVVLLRRLIDKLHRVAKRRDCSVNRLVNSGLATYYSKERTKKLGTASRPAPQSARTTYDKMSPVRSGSNWLRGLPVSRACKKDGKTGFPTAHAMNMTRNSKELSKSRLPATGSR
jgi:hypothetical protein